MKKIPTLFVRDENDRRYVTEEVTPGCEWVLAGEGVATRKYDGTCVMFDGEFWYARGEVKKGKSKPPNFIEINYDPITEKRMGWMPIAGSSFYIFFREAVVRWMSDPGILDRTGTYELCGPKINKNPERFNAHYLIKHNLADQFVRESPTRAITFDMIEDLIVRNNILNNMEGIVWHHPDGRMAKLKARDFQPR